LERRLTSRPIAATENTGIIPVSALSEAIQKGREALETLRACIPIQSSGTWETVELNDLITDALKLATPNLLGASMVVDWQATSTPLSITGDAAQLFNLFKQLIDNAIEAVNEKRGGRRELRIVCTPKKDSIDLFIEDSGSGIAEENRYKVFQPFFTGKGASQQHLGLGLTMAQEIVTQHGGTIDIDPTFHNGCRVRLQLPRLAGEVHV
jgi:nitrogen fixation negative regulator NifL